jgi:asparagine synthase (glutamine-hydrolysing)
MCGIGGFLGEFDIALLSKMGDTMVRRGPDDFGKWFDRDDSVGLCHRRLAIIDLSRQGHQPMIDWSQRFVIVFNGEIYNYRELRSELVAQGYAFASETDTEVLLNLYLRDGVAMLGQLNGMFAFAIWDKVDKSLFLARDLFGVKPLYYAESNKGFVFGSTLLSLLNEESISRELDASALVDYVTLMYSQAPTTMLRMVRKLRPGHALIVRLGQVERAWQWEELPIHRDKFTGSEADAAELLRQHLDTAVARQLVSDVPVGAFLSGGLDSSSVVAFARKHYREHSVQCFSIAFSDSSWNIEGMSDDLPYAKAAAKYLGVKLNVIEVGPEIFGDLSEMVYHMDEPQADPAGLHVQMISKLARKMGVKVLLSGTGGDDLFSGYRRHDALMKERYWAWLPEDARRLLGAAGRAFSPEKPLGRRISKAFRFSGLIQHERIATYFHWIDPAICSSLFSNSFKAQMMVKQVGLPLVSSLEGLPKHLSSLDQMLFLEQKNFLTDHNLSYTDKMSMAESVEVRVPFLDPDLVRFAWSLPDHMKYRNGQGKWLFRKAMEPLLPHSVIYRSKTGFGVPLRRWLHVELKESIECYLSNDRIRARGIFDVAGVRRLIELDRQGKVDGAYSIFALICIEIWCSLFLDGGWRAHASSSA